jgi:uncharacterized membrane protein YphA (DoxX/SURF4 family)
MHNVAAWLGRGLLGFLFVYAAMEKLSSPRDFAEAIAAYQVLPAPLISIVALGLPVFELACGALVLSGFYMRVGVLGMTTMLLVFNGALLLARVRGLAIDCGCFGGHSWLDAPGWISFARDGVLLLMAIMLYRVAGVQTHQKEIDLEERAAHR